MKNNYPTNDDAESLEQALQDLHDRKVALAHLIRIYEHASIIMLVLASVTLGIMIGLQLQ